MIDPDDITLGLEQRPATQFANLCPNPNGQLGGYWWSTPQTNTAIRGEPFFDTTKLVVSITHAPSTAFVRSAVFPCDRSLGLNVYVWFEVLSIHASSIGFEVWVIGMDAAGTYLGASPASTYPGVSGSVFYVAASLPAGTKQARLQFSFSGTTAGDVMEAGGFAIMTAATEPEMTLPSSWHNVSDVASSISIHRAELDVGTVTASLHSSALDPAQTDYIRPGQAVQVSVAGQRLFTGAVTGMNTVYAHDEDGQPQPPTVTLTGVDGFAGLASQSAPSGVASAAHLPKILEDKGIPWNVDGSTAHVAGPDPSYANPDASVMDQLVITCDTTNRRCYVSRDGVLTVHPAPTALPFNLTDEPAATGWKYVDVAADYATDDCINAVTIARIETDADGPVTVRYGPYRDLDSVTTWGTQAAEYTVYAVTPATTAAAILATSADPGLKVRTVAMQVETPEQVAWAASIDPGRPVSVTFAGDTYATRVTSVTHTLIARRDVARPVEWRVELTLAAANARRAPQTVAQP